MKLSILKILQEGMRQEEEMKEALRKHRNKFISFSDVPNKLGVNPRGFSSATPVGVYGYIIGQPLAGLAQSRKYYYIFDVPGDRVEISSSGRSSVDSQVPELLEKISSMYDVNIGKIAKRGGSPMQMLMEATRRASMQKDEEGFKEVNGAKWNRILSSLGIDCIVDNGSGTIYGSEPSQVYVSSGAKVKILFMGMNPKFSRDGAGDLRTNIQRGREGYIDRITGGRGDF